MTLKKGSVRATVSANMEEMVDGWKNVHAIGTSHPKNKKQATKQVVAITLICAGTSNKQTKPSPKKMSAHTQGNHYSTSV